MAKRKKPSSRHSAARGSRSGGARAFFHFIWLKPVRILLLTAIIAWLAWWQWPRISAWCSDVAAAAWGLFGWGIVVLALALLTIIVIIWRHNTLRVIYHWNQWLGGIAFVLTAWGMLAFFGLGGSFGSGIIGQNYFLGALRLLALVAVGLVLVAPGASLRFLGRIFNRAAERIEQGPAGKPASFPTPTVVSRPPAPSGAVPPPLPAREIEVVESAPSPRTPQELKQVTQDAWRKSGESSSLVTVDGWKLPPIDILDNIPEIEFGQADNAQRARLIEDALNSYGVEAKVVQINAGPTVTQFGVEPGWDRKTREVKEKDRDGNIHVRQEEVSKVRVKVDRITSLSNDLALALASPSIRIEAPVPGKSMVGVEVPNTTIGMVGLRSVIETNVFQKLKTKTKLALALGKGAGGEAVSGDLTRMPHLLIAGATGSGKTVCLASIICCLLAHNTPNDVKFIMIDPKRVELTMFNGIPHLATPVIVETDKAINILRWLNQEMDRRYQKLATVGARNIEGYNKNREGDTRLPYIVLFIDELADLMMAGFEEVEHTLCRLAQLARAIGIHLIVATQRPSVDVVTGLIKANFPSRISFAVTSQVDSRTILDMGGAEKLLGRGDMLYMPTEAAKPKRLQGCNVSDTERERLVNFWSNQKREEAGLIKSEDLDRPVGAKGAAPDDSLLEEARALAKETKNISTSFLQRRLRIGYPRAARLMEQLEAEGIKGEQEES
jgi:DNA segregation ATPase FtsK/SpoIIIE, S-DNA-T family